MPKRASGRWKGWRVNTSGTDVVGRRKRTCAKCHTSFVPPPGKSYRWCKSCAVKAKQAKRERRG